MSHEYILYLDTELSPKTILERVYAEVGWQGEIEQWNRGKQTDFIGPNGPGFQVFAAEEKSGGFLPYIEEVFRIQPKAHIFFGLNWKFTQDTDLEEERDGGLIKMVLAALKQISGDTLLVFDSVEASLLRRDNLITVDTSRYLWRPEMLSHLTLPYVIGDLSAF